MKTELLNPTKLKITFENEELEEYGLSFEELDYSNTKTRRVFSDALARAKKETGFDYSGSRLFIEVFPERKGGCSAMFTKLPVLEEELGLGKYRLSLTRTYSFSKDYGLCLYRFQFDGLLDCVRSFSFENDCHASDLFFLDGEFYLLLHLDESLRFRSAAARKLSEFGAEVQKPFLKKAFLEEHAECIYTGDALERLRDL